MKNRMRTPLYKFFSEKDMKKIYSYVGEIILAKAMNRQTDTRTRLLVLNIWSAYYEAINTGKRWSEIGRNNP